MINEIQITVVTNISGKYQRVFDSIDEAIDYLESIRDKFIEPEKQKQ